MVRDRTYEASTANTTAIASGRNSAAAGPLRKNMGTNTIEMEIVETKAGVAICAAPSTMAGRISFPCSMFRLMFSIVTVASSTRIPMASASPLRVMTLSVCPSAASPMIEHSTASGIEVAMMSVLRQLPRKSRIMSAVRQAAISASRMTPEIEARGAAVLEHAHVGAVLSVLAHDVGLDAGSVADVRDVADVDHRPVDLLDR